MFYKLVCCMRCCAVHSHGCFAVGKPEITSNPTDLEVQFGATAVFHCSADGDPDPEIIWLHNRYCAVCTPTRLCDSDPTRLIVVRGCVD